MKQNCIHCMDILNNFQEVSSLFINQYEKISDNKSVYFILIDLNNKDIQQFHKFNIDLSKS